jgi:hypothetical protein
MFCFPPTGAKGLLPGNLNRNVSVEPPISFAMAQSVMDLFVSIVTEGGDHDIPDTFFPSPRYFVRSSEKPLKGAPRLKFEADSDDERQDARHFQYVSKMKKAIGMELAESCKNMRLTATMAQRANDEEWDLVFGTVPP